MMLLLHIHCKGMKNYMLQIQLAKTDHYNASRRGGGGGGNSEQFGPGDLSSARTVEQPQNKALLLQPGHAYNHYNKGKLFKFLSNCDDGCLKT